MKRMYCVLTLVLLLAFVSNTLAVTIYEEWTGLGDGVTYGLAGNWANTNGTYGSIVPSATDHWGAVGAPDYKAGFKRASMGVSPTFSAGILSTDVLVVGGGASANPSVTISGATINVSGYYSGGAGATDNGSLVLNSGTISTGVEVTNATFYVTQLGTGKLTMNGGTINCGLPDPTWVGRPANYNNNFSMTGTSATSSGTVALNGGIINALDLLKGSGTASLVVKDGTLVLKTDRTAEINGYVTAGWLKAAPNYTLHVDYDGDLNLTSVYAIPEPATICLLGFGLLGLLGRKK